MKWHRNRVLSWLTRCNADNEIHPNQVGESSFVDFYEFHISSCNRKKTYIHLHQIILVHRVVLNYDKNWFDILFDRKPIRLQKIAKKNALGERLAGR